ncbi:hypothetical protein ACP4OV_024697 [Aristida adscensionis]
MRFLQAEELFRKILESGSKNKRPRLLGLDVGSKYVGLAVSDEQNRIALPLRCWAKQIKLDYDGLPRPRSVFPGWAGGTEFASVCAYLGVLSRTKTNINLMADDFKTLVSKYSLAGFVVGCPFNLRGQPSPVTVQVGLLVGELCETRKLDDMCYTYWDESFTSKCVEALLHPLNLKNWEEAKTMTDKFAAVCILQGYLDNMNRKLRSTDKFEA